MIREVAQCRLAPRVEPASHACEVPVPGGVWQIVGQGPDAQQRRKQMGLRIRERESNGPAMAAARDGAAERDRDQEER